MQLGEDTVKKELTKYDTVPVDPTEDYSKVMTSHRNKHVRKA